VAIVTGGSRGIGAGIARALSGVGAGVVICGRDPASGEQTARDLSSRGPGWVRYVPCDVGDVSALEGFVDVVVDRYGRLDCLVNNAATFAGWKPIDDIDLELVDRMVRTNALAYVVSCKRALPHLRRTKGTIINVSSLAGEIGLWHDSVYCATKGWITSLTRALAVDEAAHGVRVNALLPGNILSDSRIRGVAESVQPEPLHALIERWQWMDRSGTIEEAGLAALFLATPMSSFCTGIGLVVSGGLELGVGVKEPYPDFGRPDMQALTG
jgi:NAD(P)-dependent dehydrogenase (short-subunit alcohol dehydrogenase family)